MSHFTTLCQAVNTPTKPAVKALYTDDIVQFEGGDPRLGKYLPLILQAANTDDDFENCCLAVLEVIKTPFGGRDQPETDRVAYAIRETMTGRRLARKEESRSILPDKLRDDLIAGVDNFSDLVDDDSDGDDGVDAVLSLVASEMFTVDEAVTALSRPTDALLRRMALSGLCARSTCGWAHELYMSFLAGTVTLENGVTATDVDAIAIADFAERESLRKKAERKNIAGQGFFADPADEANNPDDAWIERWVRADDADGMFDHSIWETLAMTFAKAYKVPVADVVWDPATGTMETIRDYVWVEGDEYGITCDIADTDELDRDIAELRGMNINAMLDLDLATELPLFEKPAPEVLAKQLAWMQNRLQRPAGSGYWHNPKFQAAKARAIIAGYNGDAANALAFQAAYRTGKEAKVLTDARRVRQDGISTADGKVLLWAQAIKVWDLLQAPDLFALTTRIRATADPTAVRLAGLIERIRLAV